MGTHPLRAFTALAIGLCIAGCGAPQPAERAGEPALPPTPAIHADGQRVYEGGCASCHDVSREGAPRLGFLRAWKRRLAQGEAALVRSAIEGVDLMPPRGDNPELTDQQVAGAVRYMIYRAELDIPAGR